VLVGISDTSFVGSVGVANHAARSGAAAAVLAAPYYFLSSKDDLLRYVKRIALDISLPLFLYNIPSLTKVFVFTAVPDYDASLWQNHFSLNGETAPITGGGPGLDTKGQTPQ
jgi:hypothetical protein